MSCTRYASAIAKTDEFTASPYKTFYHLAFSARPDHLDAAGIFIYRIAEVFTEELAAVSGIELSREKTELVPDNETIEMLLESVPFVIGAEFVTRTWIKRQYRRFLEVFRKEIKEYSGKVSLYFAEKNEKLHVPERVFFHLVENNQGDYPFAFLATYATKTENGGVRHVPLQYALTEYNGDKRKILDPLLFFTLRGIDTNRFVDVVIANRTEMMLANVNKPSKRILSDTSLSDIFGVI